jgi:hypothetical protein
MSYNKNNYNRIKHFCKSYQNNEVKLKSCLLLQIIIHIIESLLTLST